ncbi:MAG: hypothetical protein AAF570_17750, partial [Bacteroidota bacterium]
MSSAVQPGTICEAIQQELESVAGMANPHLKRTKTGLLDALRSEANRSGEQIRYDLGNGQKRIVQVEHLQRVPKSEVKTSRPVDCKPQFVRGYKKTPFEICDYMYYGEQVPEDYMSQLCEGNSRHFMRLLNSCFNGIAERIEEALIATVLTKFGVNMVTGSTAVQPIQLFDMSNGKRAMDENWITFRDTDLDDANKFYGTPMIVGQGLMSEFVEHKGIACCNSMMGRNADELMSENEYGFWKSQLMNSSLGQNECIIFEAGAMQFLTYHRYRHVPNGDVVFQEGGTYGQFRVDNGEIRGVV